MADIDYNALSQAIDTTWGRSSTPQTASYSVKLSLVGAGMLVASYAAVVNFGSERQMIEMKRRYEDESKKVTSEVLKTIKSNYKELSGSSLKAKEVSTSDSVEIVGFNVHNPRRTAYYRRKTVFEVA